VIRDEGEKQLRRRENIVTPRKEEGSANAK
jgi:hypothetical protein